MQSNCWSPHAGQPAVHQETYSWNSIARIVAGFLAENLNEPIEPNSIQNAHCQAITPSI